MAYAMVMQVYAAVRCYICSEFGHTFNTHALVLLFVTVSSSMHVHPKERLKHAHVVSAVYMSSSKSVPLITSAAEPPHVLMICHDMSTSECTYLPAQSYLC